MSFRRYIKGDRVIWIVVLILLVISLLSVYSSTGSLAYQYRSGNTLYYLFRQLKFILLGLLIIFFVHLVPYRMFSRISVFSLYLAIPLLVLTMFRGTNINEATRWLEIPGTGLTIQPSDFAKVALVMFIAKILSVNQNNIKDFRGVFLKISAAIVITCLLILPANLSTAVILFVTSFTLMFVGPSPDGRDIWADAQGKHHLIAPGEIESKQPLTTSIMPTGLHQSMTRDELRDLLAILESLK